MFRGDKMSTEVLVKKDLILGGLTCAHCTEEIGKGNNHLIKNIIIEEK